MIYNSIYKRVPTSKKISSLKNTEDNSCYIFGDGKSLKYYDLKNFSLLPSMTLGNLIAHNDVKFLNLKYSLICDSFAYFPKKTLLDYLRRSYLQFKKKDYKEGINYLYPPTKILKAYNFSLHDLFQSHNDMYQKLIKILHCSNYYFCRSFKNAFYYNNALLLMNKVDNIISNSHFNIFASSLRFSIYFAIILGFKKIYLVGCDYLDIEPKVGHWYEIGKPDKYTGWIDISYLDFMRQFIEIKVIAQNKSHGENYISYKDFFGKDLKYRENFEILSKKKLEILNNWDYNIYNNEKK